MRLGVDFFIRIWYGILFFRYAVIYPLPFVRYSFLLSVMPIFSLANKESELRAFALLLFLLAGYSVANIFIGPFLPAFVGLVLPAALLTFFFPRAGFFASVVMTIVFERFYTLSPLVVGDTEYKLYALDAILASAFFSVLVLAVQEGRRLSRLRVSDMLFGAFLVWSIGIFFGGLIASPEMSLATAFSTLKNYVFYGMLFFFVSYTIRSRDEVFFFAKVFLGGVALATTFLALGIIRGGGLWTEYTPLSTAGTRFLAFPHAFTFSLAFLAIFFSAPFWFSDKKRKAVLLWFLTVLAVGIVGSLMRHLWLGISGAIVFGLLFFPSEYKRIFFRMSLPFISVGASVLVIALSTLSLFPQSDVRNDLRRTTEILSERIFSIGNRYDESLAWREGVWASALGEFGNNPLFGIGFGAQVPVELGDYRSYVEVRNMHNSWLALLIQTGLIGALLFASFLFSLFVTLFKTFSKDAFFMAAKYSVLGLIVFQCLIFFSQPYLETNLLGIFFWITLGLARVLVDIPKSARPRASALPIEP